MASLIVICYLDSGYFLHVVGRAEGQPRPDDGQTLPRRGVAGEGGSYHPFEIICYFVKFSRYMNSYVSVPNTYSHF